MLDEEILRAGPNSAISYPDFSLAKRLSLIAQVIKAGLTTSIYYTQLGGFDTHLNQVGTHPALLQELGGSLRAFFTDLDRANEATRVLVLVYSEFGRRLAENASGGTDHGRLLQSSSWGQACSPGCTDLTPTSRILWTATQSMPSTSAGSTPRSSAAGSAALVRKCWVQSLSNCQSS